eukprot:jgi/Tetstr1/425843/TSEL_016220.t1
MVATSATALCPAHHHALNPPADSCCPCIMSAPVAASAYWRIAGMSYLKYANLCGDMVRSAMKEGPSKVAAKQRELVYYRSSAWEGGKPTKQVITDMTELAEGAPPK